MGRVRVRVSFIFRGDWVCQLIYSMLLLPTMNVDDDVIERVCYDTADIVHCD